MYKYAGARLVKARVRSATLFPLPKTEPNDYAEYNRHHFLSQRICGILDPAPVEYRSFRYLHVQWCKLQCILGEPDRTTLCMDRLKSPYQLALNLQILRFDREPLCESWTALQTM